MKLKIIALILACVTVAAMIASCGGKGNDAPKEEATSSNAAETETEKNGEDISASDEEINGIKNYVNELAGKINVTGSTFTWFGPNNVGVNAPEKSEETGDILSDAVYYRQRDIEDIYGVKWENLWGEHGEDVATKVINEVMAAGQSYDLVYGSVRSAGTPMLNAGVLSTTNDLEYVDLDQRWWVASLRDTFSIRGNLYFLIGPIVVNSYTDTDIIIFNKKVTSMFGIDDTLIYDTVKEGKWTIDKMFEIASVIPENVSGSGVYRYITPCGFPFLFSSGMTLTKFDDDGVPYVDDALPKEYSDLADKLSAVFSDPSQSAFEDEIKKEDYSQKYGSDPETMFADNRGLFFFVSTDAARYMREYDVTFGIIPMPKQNGSQKEYYSFANSWGGSAVYFPKTIKNRPMSDAIAESMAALSQIYVKDAYYTKLLKSQAIFDLESRDMLDIIFTNKIYDMADLYAGGNLNNWGPMIIAIDQAIRLDSSTFASNYKGNARVVKMNIKMLLKTLDQAE